MFSWVVNFRGLTAGFARLLTLSRTFIAGHICLTENKIWVFHPGGGSAPILLYPNTPNLLLLFYAPVSLNLDIIPISKLTTHSPRMVNNQYHAPTPDLTRCDCAIEMQSFHVMLCHATCNIYKFWIFIFPAYNFYSSQFTC